MHETYLAFYLGRKSDNPQTEWLDRLICFVTRSRYSHVELVYDYSIVSKIGYSWSSSPRDGGVRPQRIDFNSGHWEVFKIPTKYSPDQIMSWFSPKNGKKYDWLGAIGSKLPFFGEEPARWFCSEIIAACLGYEDPHELTPQELFDIIEPQAVRII